MRASIEFQLKALMPQLKLKNKETKEQREKRQEEWKEHIESIL